MNFTTSRRQSSSDEQQASSIQATSCSTAGFNDTVATSGNGNGNDNNTLSMLIMLGIVGTAAGFTMYTRRTASMLKQMEHMSKQQAKRQPARKIGPYTKEEWDKIRPRLEKDELF